MSTGIRSVVDLRVDPAGKGLALALALVVHGGVAVSLLSGATAPKLLEAGLPTFEIVDLAPNEVEPEEPPPAPAPEQAPEPEPEPVVEPVPEPEPAPPEPDPIPEEAALPDITPPIVAPPPRKPPPPKPEPQARPAPKPVTPAPVPAPKLPVRVAEPKPMVSVYRPPRANVAALHNPKPFYPAAARRRGMEGLVLLWVEVSVEGTVVSVTVKKSSGYSLLDKAAARTVGKWRFVPATRGGRRVAASVEVPIRFRLTDA